MNGGSRGVLPWTRNETAQREGPGGGVTLRTQETAQDKGPGRWLRWTRNETTPDEGPGGGVTLRTQGNRPGQAPGTQASVDAQRNHPGQAPGGWGYLAHARKPPRTSPRDAGFGGRAMKPPRTRARGVGLPCARKETAQDKPLAGGVTLRTQGNPPKASPPGTPSHPARPRCVRVDAGRTGCDEGEDSPHGPPGVRPA